MDKKSCGHCLELKTYKHFTKCKTGRFGLHNHCRSCQKKCRHEWYLLNRKTELIASREYQKTDKAKAAGKKRYERDRERILLENRNRRKTPHARNLANIARNKIWNENPSFRIAVDIRGSIRRAITGLPVSKAKLIRIGCSVEELRKHIESKFTKGMTWNNYGYRGWHIDHIVSCKNFDLTKRKQQLKCSHYSNLQPLWMRDNMSKNHRLASPRQK